MGFSWTSILVGDIELDDIIDEIQTNIETVYSDLLLGAPSWTNLPVNAGDFVKNAQFVEIRNKVDYADDMNYCRQHNAAHDSTFDNDINTGVDSGDNIGYDASYDLSYDSSHDKSEDASAISGYDSIDYGSNYSTDDAGYDSSDDIGAKSGDNGDYNSGFEANVY